MDQDLTLAATSTAVTDVVWLWFLRQIERVRKLEIPGWLWVVLLWALMAFPAAGLRATHLEEGTVVGLARGAVEEGHWLATYLYGIRFVERPVLLSWIAAAIGKLTGGVTLWSVRLPHLAFLLAGGLMVFDLVKSHSRTPPAVFGALCWFACPMVAQKFVTAEPDVTVSVLLFGAFFLWWKGVDKGRVSLWRWVAVGIALTAAALTKGPQPVAYFTLGVGAFILIRRRWGDIPGFVLANAMAGGTAAVWYWAVIVPGDMLVWKVHSRLLDMPPRQMIRDHLDFLVSILLAEWLPGSLLIAPAIIAIRRNALGRESDLVLAALLYAGLATLVLLIWPGGIATRYAMPANLGLAVVGGILFDRWWSSKPWLIAACNTIVIAISSALIILGWLVMPLAPDLFRHSKMQADVATAVRSTLPAPAPLYVSRAMANFNVLAYVAPPIRVVWLEEIEDLPPPALAILTEDEVAMLASRRPDLRFVRHANLLPDRAAGVFEIQMADKATTR